MPNIPLSSPDITDLEVQAVVDVLHSPTLSIGPRVEEFEQACAKVCQRRFGVAVSSGTAGLHACMVAANIGSGDEVITTPFSFVASANCFIMTGAKPVFVDIDPKTYNLDTGRLRRAITPRTKAIVAVEAFGHPGGMEQQEAIAKEHELTLIEDSCEGFGGAAGDRVIGSFGLASVFGFYPNKQITTGEGGMIVTDDPNFAQMCRSLRNQGRDGMNWLAHARLGFNYRLSEINAALGLAQVSRLDEILENRRRVAHWYMRRLIDNRHIILPTLDDETHMSWFVFVIRLNDLFGPSDRDVVMKELRSEGIGCNNYFPPIHLQPYMKEQFGFREGDFPVTESLASRTLALPFFTKMTEGDVDRVVTVLNRVLERVLMKGTERR
jgi:perosamine synthetase